jgi:predicted PurR-regulated permease PerM
MTTGWDVQRITRDALILALVLASVWMLWQLLPALAWAAVLAIATWPLRQWLVARGVGRNTAAALLTIVLAVAVILPLIRIGVEAARNGGAMVDWISGAFANGFPPAPGWMHKAPLVGEWMAGWWQAHLTGKGPSALLESLGLPSGVGDFLKDTGGMLSITRVVGTEVASRLTVLAFTLVTLFFLYRSGDRLIGEADSLTNMLVGPSGGDHGRNAIAAVRGAVNGLVLVGLAEGLLLGIAYWMADLKYVAVLGLVTAIFSVVPFGAPLVYGACALALYLQGSTTAAIALVVYGTVVIVVADQVVRPMLMGRVSCLPFLGALLGIVGGLETFGLLGLFLGPAMISVLYALWREGVAKAEAKQQAEQALASTG